MRERRQIRTRPAALALKALLLTCFSACQESSGPPVPFRLGQTIPIGEWSLRVRQPEVVSPTLLTGFHDLKRNGATSKILAVHLALEPRSSSTGEKTQPMEQDFVKLMAGFRLKDREGGQYPLGYPVPDTEFRVMKSGGMMSESEMKDFFFSGPSASRIPRDWVVLYSVPQERSGFTFVIRNFFPLEGQPPLASVDLGR
jgi:hypothetical protein